jgi:integrase
MALTHKEVRNAKPGRHSDGNGLYLLVKPSGSASWVLRVQHEGERKDFGLGSLTLEPVSVDIPLHRLKLLTLPQAREKARMGRALAKAGINPSEEWRRQSQEGEPARTFRVVADEVYKSAKGGWKNDKHADQWINTLETYAFPEIGDTPVDLVDASAVQKVLLPIWLTKGETARRVKQRIGTVLDHAHAKGWRPSEAPMRAINQLMGNIKQRRGGHFSAMPHKDLPAFAAKLRDEDPSVGRLALQFLLLTAARPGEVRYMTWAEIDLDAAEWRIPAERMKAGKPHIIPLVPAAIAILERMRELFGSNPEAIVFPGVKGKAISDVTMNKALRTSDANSYSVHGFRSTFRDWAAENGFNNDWAEAALAHTVAGQEGKTAAAYKRTTYFEHRKERLMPAWASFVLSDEANVVQLVKTSG